MIRVITSLRSSSSSSTIGSSHQFLQRCSVSGTAKGKSKMKTGQPLKRQKVTKNKPWEKSDTKSVPRKSELDKLMEECLNAPSPLRHLTSKQREREEEREKLGLVSKERQRELNLLKERAKKGEEPPLIMGTPGLDFITLGMVDADAIPKYELTAEDGKRLAKEYSRVLMRKHRARQSAESMLLRLKKEAIEALPQHLKAAALISDMTPFPSNRFMATLTPPIDGYIDKITEATNESLGGEKIR